MDTTFEKENSRIEELQFLISIMTDLVIKYPNHNKKLLEEIISNFEYRRDTEETTVIAKSKSEEFKQNKVHYRK